MTRPLRILVAHNVPRTRTGGMSRIMGFIHDHVAAAGHTVDYFDADDVPPLLGGRLARFTFQALLLRRLIGAARADRRYDVVNVHEPHAALPVAFKAAAGNPAVVVTSHGLERRGWELALEEARLGRQGPSLKTRLVYPPTSLWPAAFGQRRADHLFCLNEEDRDYLTRWLGCAADRVTRIYPAADPAYAAAAAGRDYARGDRLLFAATWRKNKGVEDLVPAFAELAARRPGLTLTVLGGGVPDATVLAAFPEHLRGCVRCVQTKTEAENTAAFRDADVFLLPSLFEGTPLTLLEAMASGLPLVTTATCGMKDVVRDGENGLLVPIRAPGAIAAAVGRLLDDRALRQRLGRTAQQEALVRYTWDKVAVPVRQAYERLGEAQRGPKPRANGMPVPDPAALAPSAPYRPLRVLLVSFIDDNEWTGMGKWTHRVARGLGRLGLAPTLWFANDFPRTRRFGRLAVLLFPVVLAARLVAVRRRFDVFVVHEPAGLWYGLLRKLFPSLPPLVVMCHNVESNYFRALLAAARQGFAEVPVRMRAKTRFFRHWQTNGAVRLADHVICLSTVDRDYLTADLGCDPVRVTRLVNGLSGANYYDHAQRDPGRRVLFVGGWLAVKGRHLLPPLWTRVRARFPMARLTVVGTGRPEAEVLADFAAADRASVSVVPRVVCEADMTGLFIAHNVYIMPSLSEGSPLALLEAMAAMLPVVAARVGGIPDIVTDGVDGLLFRPLDPADGAAQVCCLLDDPTEALRLARAGQERVRALTWEATARELAAALEKVALGLSATGGG